MPLQFDPDCPFTQEDVDRLNELASAPLDYEIKALQEQDEEDFMHKSSRPLFEEKMRELGLL